MLLQSFRRAGAVALAALLPLTFAGAQDSLLRITSHQRAEIQDNKVKVTAGLDRASAFSRIKAAAPQAFRSAPDRARPQGRNRAEALAHSRMPASTVKTGGIGTGGGDIFEIEPNDFVAQGVALPGNIFGEISVNGDVDYFAFRGMAGQQVTIEPFAARLRNSQMIADIALFDSAGRLLARDVGGRDIDPLIRYTPDRDEMLVVGVADIDDLGGPTFDYLLNLTRGIDVEEIEPNDRRAQNLSGLPVTIFGNISERTDVDFYSFVAESGQTLIVDADAEVLGSRLDTQINLLDPISGVEFFYNDQYDGDDSRFNIVLPYTGRYVIGIGSYDSNSSGFYRMNISLVPISGAPRIGSVARVSGKVLHVTGSGFSKDSIVEVNGKRRKTKLLDSGTLRAKVKSREGDVVTVANPPDDRRSNPLIVQ